MNFPCPDPINCPGTDDPLANLSSADPDVARFFGFHFNPWGPQLCIATSQAAADRCSPPPATNPQVPIIYSSNAQSCTLDCGDSTSESYTVVSGTFVGLSQAQADAAAHTFACALALILCQGGTVTIYTNTAQSCTVVCADQTTFTYTFPAGLVAGLTQGAANTLANELACTIAAQLCAGSPPNNQGIPPLGGAGVPPPFPGSPWFTNAAQSCQSTCPDGESVYNFVVPAGLFIQPTLAEANAIALSYACNQAGTSQGCLSAIETGFCVGTYFEQTITESGLVAPVVWALISGSLPSGVLFSGGTIAGTPTTNGNYTFTVRATGADGSYTQRNYSIDIAEILPSSVPNGTNGTPYSQLITVVGATAPITWSVIAGALPTGLVLNSSTGLISGTPTASGTFAFTVQMQSA